MRFSKANWSHGDLDALYRGYGFAQREGAKHVIYLHPDYPDLRATVTRGSGLAKGYIAHAVRSVDELLKREALKK